MIHAVERKGRPIAGVAEDWVNNNTQIWNEWLPAE
jgi:ABC-type proline/glycine betaine transport system substrate-binding protein